jgi:hypothetical protein
MRFIKEGELSSFRFLNASLLSKSGNSTQFWYLLLTWCPFLAVAGEAAVLLVKNFESASWMSVAVTSDVGRGGKREEQDSAGEALEF